ncbi:MAG TPA: glycosyltransferase family 4 protein [Candidatus Dormibacteraeota bacterium]|nr:glycosyltransferase family 4 protein [Candidatus Dormibacteraeota bacterium]
MPQPLRIAVIGPRGIPSSYSGIERVTESLYGALAVRGHDVTVYCRPEYVERSPQFYKGIRLVGTPAVNGRSMGTVSHVFTSSAHALWRARYDVVHLHALAPGLAAPLYRRLGVPTVATVHGIDWQRAKWKGLGARVLRRAERWLVHSVDEIITVSRDLEAYYRTTYGRGSSLIPNGTDLTPEAPLDPALLERLGLTAGEYVLFVARLVPEKRVEDLIRAFRALDTRARLALVGDSSHTDTYAAGLRREAAGDARIVFTGVQPRANVETLFRGATAFVLPSELEGMSMALLQALEMGVPSIVSGLPVHHELLDRIEGYDLFFAPGDVSALQERLHRLLTQRERYRRVALRAQAYIRRAHSWPAIAEQTERLYQRLVQRRRPATLAPHWHAAGAAEEAGR